MMEKLAVMVAWLPTTEANRDNTLKKWRIGPGLAKCSHALEIQFADKETTVKNESKVNLRGTDSVRLLKSSTCKFLDIYAA